MYKTIIRYDFSKDAVLMVLASDYYREEDYIRSYEEFLSYTYEMSEDKKNGDRL